MLTIEELIVEAKKAREKAYARYSGFKVGAVIECKDGKLIYGAKILVMDLQCVQKETLYFKDIY